MDNLFENFVFKKWVGKWIWKNKRSIRTEVLYDFSLKCDDIKWWCDWMTFVSMHTNNLKVLCPCFNKIVNDTNSDSINIPGDELQWCPFESVSVERKVSRRNEEYFDLHVSYEWESYHIMQFWFYWDAKEGQKKIMADFKIYGQCWRLQSMLDNKFLIAAFVPSLLSWWLDSNISDMDMEEDSDEFLVLSSFCTYYLTRFDFRIDFFHPDRNFIKIPAWNKVCVSNRKHGNVPFDNFVPSRDIPKWYFDRKITRDYTGYTVWKKSDRYAYIRFYQKQCDIFRKSEKALYYDYIKYPGSVWRLEFQFGSRFTTSGDYKFDYEDTFGNIFGWDSVWFTKKVFEFLGINEKTAVFSRFYFMWWVPFNEKSQFSKQIMIGQFASYWDKFNKSSINCFSALAASLKMKKWYTDEEIDNLKREFLENKDKNDEINDAFAANLPDNSC